MHHFLESGMIWKIFNFVVFFSILFFVLRKPVREFWKTRAHKISFEMEEAARLRREAAERVLALEEKIDLLDRDTRAIINSLRDQGELEKKKIIEDAKSFAEKLKNDAELMISQETLKAKEKIKREMVEISVAQAEALIRSGFSHDDQERLGQAFLGRLEERV